MNKVLIVRYNTGDQGTLGFLYSPEHDFSCYTLELPWRDNKTNISCIPKGEYGCVPYHSQKYKEAYQVLDVPERTYILFHSGNVAGDIEKGYLTHSNGCILLGKYYGTLNNQKAVLSSRPTINNFLRIMNKEPFRLFIKELY